MRGLAFSLAAIASQSAWVTCATLVRVMIADVWGRIDFIAVGVVLLGVVLLVLGGLLDSSVLDVVGVVALAVGWVVFVARRLPRRPP